LDGAIQALDGTIGPGVRRFGQPVLHAEGPAVAGKAVTTRKPLVGLQDELQVVVGQHGMGFVGQLFWHPPQKGCRDHTRSPRVQLGKRHFTGAVNGHEEVLAALCGAHFGEVDVQVA